MEVAKVNIDREQARELWRKYHEHVHYQQPLDAGIQKIYQQIARGREVIQARASILAAGIDESMRPRLAIARADLERVYFDPHHRHFAPRNWMHRNAARSSVVSLGRGSFAGLDLRSGWAQVPLVPVHVRPRRGIANYHILFEADWTAPPIDPYLLRHLAGDAWLVVAAWNLTAVERAAMMHTLGQQQ